MELLGSTVKKINKDKNGKNLPHFEVIKAILVNCNLVNSSYQQNLGVFYTYLPNKSFDQLLEISPRSFNIFEDV